ncbi:MAG: HAMP domain-containing sensor histidine kinase, partial [Chloroflexota bacterium]
KNSVILARIETQLKLSRLQREHKQYIAFLEDNETLRQQLSKIASHDLKNPLNNLRLVTELLSEETNNHPRIQPLLNTMNASLDMMDDIVASFVDVVEIQTRNITLNLQAIEIHIIIMNTLMQYELTAEHKNINVKIGSTDGVVHVDEARTAQIVGNLLSNAIKYSPRDSVVKIFSESQDSYVRLYIADAGKGVPKAERHRLFEEFADISTRPTDGENSTGLGLWIVRHLTELQGGNVGADFPDTGGSVFWVEFPAYKH